MILNLCVYAHYDPHGLIDDYVRVQISALAQNFTDVVFVSTSALSSTIEVDFPSNVRVCVKDNVGYDFGSWRYGLSLSNFHIYDEVLICNDSVYGPFFCIQETLEQMRNLPGSVCGITENYQWQHHLQSYFILFKRDALISSYFEKFWAGVVPQKQKQDVIIQYELGLSAQAKAAGFMVSALFRFDAKRRISAMGRNLLGVLGRHSKNFYLAELNPLTRYPDRFALQWTDYHVNPSHMFWDQMIREGIPFLKIELLKSNPHGTDLRSVFSLLRKHSSYSLSLIKKHLSRVAPSAVEPWFQEFV